MKVLISIIVTLIGLAATIALAVDADDTTQQMLSNCRPIASAQLTGDRVVLSQTYAIGTCMGAFRMMQRVIVSIDDKNRRIYSVCAPPDSTLTQLIKVFINYAERNPQRLHEDFSIVALDSLAMAFPCGLRP